MGAVLDVLHQLEVDEHLHATAMSTPVAVMSTVISTAISQLEVDAHLEGGILKYLEEVPKEESMWKGECFVFDNRVTVDHDLAKGKFELCHACRMPITEEDKASEKFEDGVSCPRCYDSLTEDARSRARTRQEQIALAKAQGIEHIGVSMEERKAVKQAKKDEHRRRSLKL